MGGGRGTEGYYKQEHWVRYKYQDERRGADHGDEMPDLDGFLVEHVNEALTWWAPEYSTITVNFTDCPADPSHIHNLVEQVGELHRLHRKYRRPLGYVEYCDGFKVKARYEAPTSDSE